MKGDTLYLAMQELDDALIEKYANVRPKQAIPLGKLLAACLAVVLVVGGGTVAVDAITYTQAKDFFADNGLSTEGLSRADVKAVYRDITTKSFTYEKTDDVIAQGITQSVPGYEITADMDNPEDLRRLWESWASGELESLVIDGEIKEADGDIYQKGIWYENETVDIYNAELGRTEVRETVVCKYQDDTLCWESTVPFVVRLMKPIGKDTLVIGEKEYFRELVSGYDSIPKADASEQIAYLDENGQLLWCKLLTEDEGIAFDETDWAFDNADETFTLVTRRSKHENGAWEHCICVWQFNLQGQQLSYKEIEEGASSLSDVFQLDKRYVLSIPQQKGFACKLVLMEADGTVLTDAEYQITDQLQSIQDVAQVGDYLYVSTHTMLAGEGLDEIGRPNVALSQEKKALWELQNTHSEKEVLERIRSHYTAVLLRCDVKTGEIQSFYSVPGVTADKLEIGKNGELAWYLQSLTQAEITEIPNRQAWVIRGTSVIYRYALDAEGNLVKQENTGELATYRW